MPLNTTFNPIPAMNEFYLPLITGISIILNAVQVLMYLKLQDNHDKEIEKCHQNYKQKQTDKPKYEYGYPENRMYKFLDNSIEPYYPKQGDRIRGMLLPHQKRVIFGKVIRETRRGNFEITTSQGEFKLVHWDGKDINLAK